MIMTWYMKKMKTTKKKKNHQAKREHYNKEFYSTFIRHPSTLFKKRAIKHYHLPLRFLFFFFGCSFSLWKFMNSPLPHIFIVNWCCTIVTSSIFVVEEKNITMFYFFPLSSLFIFLLWRRRIPSILLFILLLPVDIHYRVALFFHKYWGQNYNLWGRYGCLAIQQQQTDKEEASRRSNN